MSLSLPYPGLRSYVTEESHLFFGREELTNELLDKLASNRFLAVVGASGCGKSSFVRAGMLADMRMGFMPGAKDCWKIATMRPGDQPFKYLSDALQDKSAFGTEKKIDTKRLRYGLSEFLSLMDEVDFPKNTNLFILVDQFEELFRFREGNKGDDDQSKEYNRDEANAFVSLLLNLAEQRVKPVYVVITMRTDFLGDCAEFDRLPEAINRGQFLVPRLSKLQLRSAIVKPAQVFDCEVEDALVSRLLDDVGTDTDDLPLLQHVLMRIYQKDADKKMLTLNTYWNVGGFKLQTGSNEQFCYISRFSSPLQWLKVSKLRIKWAICKVYSPLLK